MLTQLKTTVATAIAVVAVLLTIDARVSADEPPGLPVAQLSLDSAVDFEKEILPVLKRNCLACHNQSAAEGDVILESPQTMAQAETDPPLLSRGEGASSQLFRVAAHRSEPVMPPEENDVGAQNLSPEELALLRLWIDQGARGEKRDADAPIAWRAVPESFVPVYAVSVAPAGDFVAAGRGRRIYMVHVPANRELGMLADPALASQVADESPGVAHLDMVQSLAFSPDGMRLVSGGYRVAKIWRRRGDGVTELLDRVDSPSGALASAESWLAVGETGGDIQVFDVTKGKRACTLEGHTEAVDTLAFSTDGSHLVSAGRDGGCRVWDTATGRPIAQWENQLPVRAVTWCAQNTQIAAACDDGAIRLWPVSETGDGESESEPPKPVGQLQGHAGPVTCLATVDDSGEQIVSGGQDGSVRLWDCAGGRQVRQFDQGGPVADVDVAGHRLVTVGANRVVRLFQWNNGQQIAEMRVGYQARQRVSVARRNLDIASRYTGAVKGDVAAAEKMRTTAEADAKKAEEEVKQAEADLAKKVDAEKTAKENERAKAEAEKNVAQRTLEASRDRLSRLQTTVQQAAQAIVEARRAVTQAEQVESQLREPVAALEQQAAASAERALKSAAISEAAATVALVDEDGCVYRFDLATGAALDTIEHDPGARIAVVATAGDRIAALAADGTIDLVQAAPVWELERTLGGDPNLPGPADRVTAVAVSPDGALVATGGGEPSRSGELMLWDLESGSLLRTIDNAHSDTVLGLAFSPRGAYLASCGADRQMKVFEVATGRPVCTYEGHTHHVLSVAWRADGRMLATGGADRVVKIWEFPSGNQQKTIEGFGKEVTSLRFLGVSDNIVAGAGSGAVVVKTSSGGGGPTYSGSQGFVHGVECSADGGVIAAGGDSGVLWIWSGQTQPAVFPPPGQP
jgi:WD40 repeat protein